MQSKYHRAESSIDSSQNTNVGEPSQIPASGLTRSTSHGKQTTGASVLQNTQGGFDYDAVKEKPTATSLPKRSATIESLTNDLQQEKQSRINAENEASQLRNKLKKVQIKWNRTTNELDQIKSQSQGFNPVTDDELRSAVTQLHFNIQSFAIQYFDEPRLYSRAEQKHSYEKYMPLHFKSYLVWPENYPVVIQAFIWNVLTEEVFDRFRWAGRASTGFDTLWYRLDRRMSRDSPKTPAIIQRLETWRATTAGLVLNCMNEEDTTRNLQDKEDIMQDLQLVLNSLSRKPYENELDRILDAAIDLDKIISSQAAKVSWEFKRSPEEEHAQRQSLPETEEVVVVRPAMIKRGKSNGEDFDVENELLPRVEGICKIAREYVV
ncbi:hypothetical protein F5Y13DRAFT_188173 [Hypoxylon sp. FL1857]|nr:hypothetical protein F5Y13DRAFT_188173 [Hypoxylon sp. FL1857]